MDKNAIKKYAIWAREELIKRVSTKAEEYAINPNEEFNESLDVIGDKLLTPLEKQQRKALIRLVKEKGFEHAMEEVAYTWFNRFIALRFMEVNGYLPSKIRIFTDEENNFKPQILDEAIRMELDGLDIEKVLQLKEHNKTDELYKYLVITQCNALHDVLPKMFPKIDDYTQLLFPENILREGSAIEQMIAIIPEEDWKDAVQILGWLYQFYNTEPKEKVINVFKGSAIKKEDIPADTQIFTTDWVVRYMVDNSLGRYWIERNPESKLAEKLEYFITPKNGEIKYIDERVNPTDLTFFDPCMGSGHILVYDFDVFVEIYLECGYSEREAAKLIIENNIFGVDIDNRAYQLSYFALMMKARSKDRRFLTRKIEPQVYYPYDSEELQNYGSIFIVEDLGVKPTEPNELTLFNQEWKKELHNWNFKRLITQKYTVVCTNPPYLNKYNSTLKKYVTDNYKEYSGDLFSVYIYKNFDYCKQNGYSAFMTPNVWMFIKSYEKLREYIIKNKSISSLIQIAKGAFYKEATVDVMCFVLKNTSENENGLYIRLEDFKGDMEVQKQKFLEVLVNKECGYSYEISKEIFSKIPGSPIAYWVSDKIRDSFTNGIAINELATPRQGMATTNNNLFLRYWYEPSVKNVGFSYCELEGTENGRHRWFPYNKGGAFRKWYGNQDYVVNWHKNGYDLKEYTKDAPGGRMNNMEFYFKPAVTWSKITSGNFSTRFIPRGFIFDVAGCSIFGEENLLFLLGFTNSTTATVILRTVSQTLNFEVEHIKKLPVVLMDVEQVNTIVTQNINISKVDWDSFETSWNFVQHPLIRSNNIKLAFENWGNECLNRFNDLKANEEELNRIFIDIYDLQDELTPEVEDKDVTVRLADKIRDVKSFISYAVGCMFGRYSLDVDGIAYAGGEFDRLKYSTFIPDKDNIIPICNDEYFEDDIVGRFVDFVKVVYGSETLEENLDFTADALGGKGNSREVIRNYFLNGFFADHCKIYQKRPIYWQLDSGKKKGFKALIYMHRYEPDTMARVRTDYVHEQQGRYRTAIEDLERRILSASTGEKVKLNKQLTILKDQDIEIRTFEEKVHHLADQMITIDLDEGVKHNYAIFGDVLTKIK